MPTQVPPTSIELPHKAYMLPEAVAMWPPVWWTWLVLAFLILLLLTGIALLWQRHRKRAYRREALQILKDTVADLSDKDCIMLCHEMIRRCLISEGKRQLAALPTEALVLELDEKTTAKYQFSTLSHNFISGPYRNRIKLSVEQRQHILNVTRYWIRKHHA
ncbi:DUF4381 domain-containing protein [Marinomonas transparens]|uniref:DUF4381 domain-containing protein n=1 Tax=Marinomonas transparens TaxID=2795388 RepID=A0A934JX06_9GAMM|nr:DUF4381 domain-containing protein [Marinomonas transparens]MBJ7538835.1 DUF4381 domain-containing protein [Marinomonas transparens]